MSRRPRTAVALLLAPVLAALLGGCVDLPTSGPVVDADLAEEREVDPASSIDARPPQPGDSRLAIVNGFLEAMEAWPISTNVAKQYLTGDAAEEWSPDAMVIYSTLGTPREDGSTVTLRMRDAAALDESGAWRDTLPPERSVLRFRLTIEDGEFRILDPLDALVVRASWFQQRYRQASLYFFDPTAQVLVPEPVFVPVDETFATNLVTALLAGPPRRLEDVVRTFVPERLGVSLSVPIIDGIAMLDLDGDAPRMSGAESELMLAQLAATLRQEPSITGLRVTIGGEEVEVPGVASQYTVASAAVFDPADTGSSGVLYGLRGGRLVVVGGAGELLPVTGPLGRESYDLATFAVAPGANRVAGVAADRRRVVVAPLRDREERGRVRTLVADGNDFARPTWDASGRLWLLDRREDGARLLVADGDGVREVKVGGVSGTDARQVLVSRDGTRLVALVGDRSGDRLVSARVVIGDRGRVERTVGSTAIWTSTDPAAIDVAWTAAAEVAVLTPALPGELFEVETVAVDGATVGVDTVSSMVPGRVIGLAGEPFAATPIFAVTRDALIDVRTGEGVPTTPRAHQIEYAG